VAADERPDAGEALGFGFGHGAEVVAPERALLLEVASDRCEVVVQPPLPVGVIEKAGQAAVAAPHDEPGMPGTPSRDGRAID